jgi:hypothetical protein
MGSDAGRVCAQHRFRIADLVKTSRSDEAILYSRPVPFVKSFGQQNLLKFSQCNILRRASQPTKLRFLVAASPPRRYNRILPAEWSFDRAEAEHDNVLFR